MSKVKNRAAQKYDQTVRRVRGEEGITESVEIAESDVGELVISADAELAGALVTMTQEEVMAELSSGTVEAAPMLVSLKPGQTLRGRLEGNGPDAELTDKDTGEVTVVPTWIIALAGGAMRVSILDTVQLAKKLPPFLNGEVAIHRGQDKRSGTRIYTDYLVWGPKGDKPRDWSGGAAPTSRRLAPGNNEHEPLLGEAVTK